MIYPAASFENSANFQQLLNLMFKLNTYWVNDSLIVLKCAEGYVSDLFNRLIGAIYSRSERNRIILCQLLKERKVMTL